MFNGVPFPPDLLSCGGNVKSTGKKENRRKKGGCPLSGFDDPNHSSGSSHVQIKMALPFFGCFPIIPVNSGGRPVS